MICKCDIYSGQKRLDGVPAKSAADSVNQGGLGHQNVKGRSPIQKMALSLRPVGVLAPSPPGFLRAVEPWIYDACGDTQTHTLPTLGTGIMTHESAHHWGLRDQV